VARFVDFLSNLGSYHIAAKSAIFTHLTGLFKNLNYARSESAEYNELLAKIEQIYNAVS